jgi:hypothetical protein
MTTWTNSARLALPAFAVVIAVFAVFHDKAYTIDDPFFLLQAEQVLKSPLDPSGFEIVWGPKLGRASEVSPTGPGMAYILTPTVALGAHEWVAHATVLSFLAFAALVMVAVAGRLGASPGEARVASVALVTIPTVLALAGTVMPDVPAMAMGLFGLERCLAFRDDRRPGQSAAIVLAFTAAILIRSHAVMLLPIAAIFLVGREFREGRWRELRILERLWPLPAAVLLVAAIAWITRDAHSGSMNFVTSLDFLKAKAIPRHLSGFFFHFVFALPFALVWALMHFRRLSFKFYLFAFVSLALMLPLKHLWATPIAAFGATTLADALRDGWKSRDPDRLALGLWLIAALPVLIYVHLPAKYLVFSSPAMALLLVLDSRTLGIAGRRAVLGGFIAFGAILGLLILQADARLAAVGRDAANRLIVPRVEAGKQVWYSGSWGFHWYAEAAGADALGANPEAAVPGDFIVYSTFRSGAVDEDSFGLLVDRVVDEGPAGRVMDFDAGAGFYSDGYGYLPWWWADGKIDEYKIWRVMKKHPAAARESKAKDEKAR